jgi:hypothetical protein
MRDAPRQLASTEAVLFINPTAASHTHPAMRHIAGMYETSIQRPVTFSFIIFVVSISFMSCSYHAAHLITPQSTKSHDEEILFPANGALLVHSGSSGDAAYDCISVQYSSRSLNKIFRKVRFY